jgi:predicted DNA-binding transcriptional regulator YafY
MAMKKKKYYDNTKTKKLENALKMLKILKEEGRKKAPELAERLGLNNKRSIYYYKKTLEILGHKIETYGGYDGGYELVEPERLSESELDFIAEKINNEKLMKKIERINKR